MEKELGVELIHRENRRFTLTPAGEYFYLQSKVLLDEVDELRRETIRIGQAEESKLRIGYLKNYSGQELHMALEFSRLYPDSFIGTARWRRGILQGYAGLCGELSLCGEHGSGPADGSWKTGLSAS